MLLKFFNKNKKEMENWKKNFAEDYFQISKWI